MDRGTQILLTGLGAVALVAIARFTYLHVQQQEGPATTMVETATDDTVALPDLQVAPVATASENSPKTVRRVQPTDPAPMPRRILVQLSEGAAAEVEVRPYRLPSIARPQRLADIYPQLRDLAEAGDASAAYGLHRWLRECEHAFADSDSFGKAIHTLRNEGIMTFPSSSALSESKRQPRREGASAATAEAVMTQAYEFCEGITSAQKEEAPTWLARAAASNELFALRAQADELLKAKDRRRFTQAYETLWANHGYTGALAPLAAMYRRGADRGEPDHVRSYAFQLTELRLVTSVYGESAYPSHRNMIVGMESALSNTGSYLSPQQTAEAVRLADRMLRDNPHCCVGLLFGATYE